MDGPAGMTLEAATGQLSWSPDGQGPVGVTIAVRSAAGADRRAFTLERSSIRGALSFGVGCGSAPGGLLLALTLVLRRRRRVIG